MTLIINAKVLNNQDSLDIKSALITNAGHGKGSGIRGPIKGSKHQGTSSFDPHEEAHDLSIMVPAVKGSIPEITKQLRSLGRTPQQIEQTIKTAKDKGLVHELNGKLVSGSKPGSTSQQPPTKPAPTPQETHSLQGSLTHDSILRALHQIKHEPGSNGYHVSIHDLHKKTGGSQQDLKNKLWEMHRDDKVDLIAASSLYDLSPQERAGSIQGQNETFAHVRLPHS